MISYPFHWNIKKAFFILFFSCLGTSKARGSALFSSSTLSSFSSCQTLWKDDFFTSSCQPTSLQKEFSAPLDPHIKGNRLYKKSGRAGDQIVLLEKAPAQVLGNCLYKLYYWWWGEIPPTLQESSGETIFEEERHYIPSLCLYGGSLILSIGLLSNMPKKRSLLEPSYCTEKEENNKKEDHFHQESFFVLDQEKPQIALPLRINYTAQWTWLLFWLFWQVQGSYAKKDKKVRQDHEVASDVFALLFSILSIGRLKRCGCIKCPNSFQGWCDSRPIICLCCFCPDNGPKYWDKCCSKYMMKKFELSTGALFCGYFMYLLDDRLVNKGLYNLYYFPITLFWCCTVGFRERYKLNKKKKRVKTKVKGQIRKEITFLVRKILKQKKEEQQEMKEYFEQLIKEKSHIMQRMKEDEEVFEEPELAGSLAEEVQAHIHDNNEGEGTKELPSKEKEVSSPKKKEVELVIHKPKKEKKKLAHQINKKEAHMLSFIEKGTQALQEQSVEEEEILQLIETLRLYVGSKIMGAKRQEVFFTINAICMRYCGKKSGPPHYMFDPSTTGCWSNIKMFIAAFVPSCCLCRCLHKQKNW